MTIVLASLARTVEHTSCQRSSTVVPVDCSDHQKHPTKTNAHITLLVANLLFFFGHNSEIVDVILAVPTGPTNQLLIAGRVRVFWAPGARGCNRHRQAP